MTTRVAIIAKTIPHYRSRFFELLRNRLAENRVELALIYGQPSRTEALKKDCVDLSWATKVRSQILEIGGKEVYWQPVLKDLRNVDLVIVEQANKLLLNHVLLLCTVIGIQKMAFWGHGRNLQAREGSPFSEWVKSRIATKAYWWFAYGNVSANYIKSLGYPTERVTCVQNAIDTRFLTRALKDLSVVDIRRLREGQGIQGLHVCIYAGGMYPEKRLVFLFEALNLVREYIPDFEMIFVGSGSESGLVRDFAKRHTWVHYVGPKFDAEKVPFFAISKLLLSPGLVGLGVLDSFALQTPLVTTNISYHSPEIEYLENGMNGLVVKESESPQAYAHAVSSLLLDESRRQVLIENCAKASEKYTIENMVSNFADGVVAALEN